MSQYKTYPKLDLPNFAKEVLDKWAHNIPEAFNLDNWFFGQKGHILNDSLIISFSNSLWHNRNDVPKIMHMDLAGLTKIASKGF